jgi:hypothetical protein
MSIWKERIRRHGGRWGGLLQRRSRAGRAQGPSPIPALHATPPRLACRASCHVKGYRNAVSGLMYRTTASSWSRIPGLLCASGRRPGVHCHGQPSGVLDTHDRRTRCSLARQHAQTRREAPDAMHQPDRRHQQLTRSSQACPSIAVRFESELRMTSCIRIQTPLFGSSGVRVSLIFRTWTRRVTRHVTT